MRYYLVDPEVAGGFGERTLIDHSFGRMKVTRLHYQMEGWLGDELLESTPCYIISKRLAQEIVRRGCTGTSFSDVEVTMSENFRQLHVNQSVPDFFWLQADGIAGKDDFGMTPDLTLVVSEMALRVMQEKGLCVLRTSVCSVMCRGYVLSEYIARNDQSLRYKY